MGGVYAYREGGVRVMSAFLKSRVQTARSLILFFPL